jgi:hypothetical protein
MNSATFKARYPQFATNPNIETYLSEALLFIGEAYEEYADMAQGLYAAHYCAIEAEEQARATAAPSATFARDVVSKGAGKLNITRNAAMLQKQSEDPWMSTTYGQRLCWLRGQVGRGVLASGAKWLDDSGTGLCSADPLVFPAADIPPTGEPQ